MKVKYDGIPKGFHTWIEEQVFARKCKGQLRETDPHCGTMRMELAPEHMASYEGQEWEVRDLNHPAHDVMKTVVTRIEKDQVIDAGDLEDGSERSRLINDHLAREVCHELKE